MCKRCYYVLLSVCVCESGREGGESTQEKEIAREKERGGREGERGGGDGRRERCITINREYFVSKIFHAIIFRVK